MGVASLMRALFQKLVLVEAACQHSDHFSTWVLLSGKHKAAKAAGSNYNVITRKLLD